MRKFYLLLMLWYCSVAVYQDIQAQCTISLGANQTICPGTSKTIYATVNVAGPDTFSWTSNPAGFTSTDDSIIVSPVTTTWYIVHGTGNGCNVKDSVKVTVKSAPLAPNITFSPNNQCSGKTISFSTPPQGGGVNFSWNFGDGTTANGTNVTHHFTSYGNGTGVFTVTCTATGANGCTTSSTKTVNVSQAPSATLSGGAGIDTVTFNGIITFYKCLNGSQSSSNFTFVNTSVPNSGVTTTIIWGDTGVNYTNASSWNTVSHVYAKGIYLLTYIDSSNGCTDTTRYKVFLGSNAAAGMGIQGSSNICGPASLIFYLSNFASNTPGTIYTVSFNDGSAPIVFSQPPPDSFSHTFSVSSCGYSSTSGSTTFNNSFSANLIVTNPCGVTGASVLPIYVSIPPVANFTTANGDTFCVNTVTNVINTSINGEAINGSNCDNSTYILWNIFPATGWTLSGGTFGTDNGYVNADYDPTSWSPGSGTLSVDFTSIGSYQIQLVAANGCGTDTIIKTICVSGPPSPAFAISPDTGCAPLSITTVNNTSSVDGCSVASYIWTVGQNSSTCSPTTNNPYGASGSPDAPVITIYNEGVYNIALSAVNACGTFTAPTQSVVVKTIPQINIFVPADVCPGQTINPTSSALPCSGTITGYNWTFQGGTPATSTSQNPGTVSMATPGGHSVSLDVTNECGTNTVNTVIVIDTLPVPVVGNNTQYCSGGGAQIGGANNPGLNYSWTPANGLTSDTISNPFVILTNTGTVPVVVTYYLTVTNTGGCSSTDSVQVTIYPQATVNAGPDDTICQGAALSLQGSYGGGASSITWTSANGGTFSNNTSTTSTYTPSITSGNVVLTITTNNPAGPCPAVSDNMTVTVIPPPVSNPGNSDSVCNGAVVQLGAAPQNGYTYSWLPATGLNATNIANPTSTLSNTGNTVLSQTYMLIVGHVGCFDTAYVTVADIPNAAANAGAPVLVCANDTITLTGSISGATSAIWTSASGTFIHPDSVITQFIPSISSGNATATLTTTQISALCPVAASSVNITVNAVPTITDTSYHQFACSGSASLAISLSADLGGTTFSWAGSSPDGVTGYTSIGNGSVIPSMILTNNSTSVERVVYVITPDYTGCPGATVNDTILVYPLPSLSLPASQSICSGDTTKTITPTSTTGGTIFNWSAVSSGNLAGYTGSGTGPIPSQTIINTGYGIDSIIYTITPIANGCNGPSGTVVIRVSPSPTVNFPVSQAVCSGGSTTPVTLSSNVAGTSFSWTANASIGISGFTTSGNGDIPGYTLNNNSTTPGTIIYAVTPSAGGCTGPVANYIITVNPIPVLSVTVAADTLCSGTATSISLSANVPGTNFNWTVNQPAGVLGAFNGSGTSIQQVLTNTDSSLETVSYFITPTANACNGNPDTANIMVLPVANIVFSPPNQTICSGSNTQPVFISSPSPGVIFSWTSQANGVSGVSASGTDTIPVQILTNNTNGPLTANYTATAGYAGCSNQSSIYSITVNPIPQDVLPPGATMCSGNPSPSISLSSNVFGATFSWTAASPNGVTGYTANGNSSLIPSQILINDSIEPAIVVYTITPTAANCPGPPANDTIIVEPLPVVSQVPSQTICSGTSFNTFVLTSATSGTTYNWSVTHSGTISGYTPTGTGNIPAQILTNGGYTIDSVVYTVTPVANNCNGPTVNYTVIVNPLPNILLPGQQTVCSNTGTTPVVISSNVSGATFSWTATATNGVSGFTANGNDSIPSQNLIDTGSNGGTVTYTITPTANGCVGPNVDYVISINPIPGLNVIVVTDTICPGTATNISLGSNVSGTNFSWTVSAPPSVTGAYNSNGTSIQQVLSNSDTDLAVVTYYIMPAANACSGSPDTASVVVLPGANINFSLADQTLCSGASTQQVIITSPSPGVAFSWISQANGISGVTATGTNTIPVQTLTNNTNASLTANYTVNAGYVGCNGQSSIYSITVNPIPQDILPSGLTVCSGNSSQSIALSSNVFGATFSWTAASPNGVTGYTASGNSSLIPSQILTNTSTAPEIVVYTVTPTAANCPGPAANDTAIVNPLPAVTALPTQTICSSASFNAFVLNSATVGTTYNWSVTHSGVISGYTPTGTGNIPGQTLTNSGYTIDSVVFTVTPVANNCNGPSVNYSVIVNPVPNVLLPSDQAICSNTSSSPVTITSNVAGTTFSWTASGTAGLTGFTTNGNGDIPSQTIVNPANTIGTVTYTITPTANNCPGPDAHYTITVNPIPNISITIAADTICPGTQTNISLSSNVSGASFNWTVNEPAGVTGAFNGNGTSIQQLLSNINTALETVSYYITPFANACNGTPDTANIIVYPGASIVFSAADQAICSGITTQQIIATSPSPGVIFSWVSQANGIDGVSASGTDTIPAQTLTNTTNGPLTANYIVTAGYAGCNSQSSIYSITVNPIPQDVLPGGFAVCSGNPSQSIALSSNVFGATFSWTGASPNGVTGYTASGNSSLIPSQILTNNSSAPEIVVFTITPTAANCPGPPANDTITVNPLPVVNALSTQTICNGGTSNAFNLASATSGTIYNWNATYSGNILGYTANGTGNIPGQTLTNSGFTIDSVVFTVTPTANNCNGPQVNYTVVVNPVPNVLLPGPQTICSNTTTTPVNITSNVAGTTFSWTATGTNGITGFIGNGNGNIPSQTIINPGNTSGSVTYTITPTANGCQGPDVTYTITINPLPVITAVPAADTICPSTQTNINLSSTVANTSFAWVVSIPVGITGASNGAGNQIQQVLSNSSNLPQTVLYIITPTAAGCNGPDDTAVALVYPDVTIQFSLANQTICSGYNTTAVNITSPSPGVNFSWTSQSSNIGGVATSGTILIPVQLLVDSLTTPASVVYTVVAGYTGCPDHLANYDITVNPTPVAILPPPQSICSGSLSQSIGLNANISGTTFTWTGASPDGVTGYTASGNSSLINSQILTNNAATPGFVIYSVIPTYSGCVGVAVNDTITVNPLPAVIPAPAQTICSDSTSTPVTLNSATPGTTYIWQVTHSGNLSGFTISGTGNILSQTIHSNSIVVDSVVYTITPTASGCMGPNSNYDIIVEPPADVILPPAQTICSGTASNPANLTSNINGTTFSWTATATAGITGYPTNGNGNIPSQILYNSTNTPGTVTYVVSPSANSCAGYSRSYVITVNPVPMANAIAALDTICDEAQTSIALSSDVIGTIFNWTVSEPNTVTGGATGSGDTITQILTNSSQAYQTVNYFITPVANGCTGNPDTVAIVVQPGIDIQYTPANQTICSGQTSQPVTISSTSPGATFTWVSQANGILGVTASGTNTIPAQTLINNSNSGIVVIYQITAGYAGCNSQLGAYEILVDPIPVITPLAAQTICSQAASQTIILNSSVFGTTYTWTGTSPNGVTGYTANGTLSEIPSQTLTNTATTAGVVVFTITPIANTCPGAAINDTIYVNPLPVAILPPAQTMCSGSTSNAAVLTSATAATTFSWLATHFGNLSGFTGGGTGNIGAQTVTNNGYIIDSVVYTVTPSANGCTGPLSNYDIIVNPVADITLPESQTVCSNTSSNPVNLSSNITGTTFNWTATASAGVTGFTAGGTGNIPAQTLSNSGNTTGSVTYTITSAANGCNGDTQAYNIYVLPVPVTTANPVVDTICSTTQTNIALTSTVANSSFAWTYFATNGITGASNGSGDLIQQLLSNNTQTLQEADYYITASINGCPGPVDTATVYVRPGFTVQFSLNNQIICSGQTSQTVFISSAQQGVTFTWVSQANGLTGVTATGADSIPQQTIINSSTEPATAVYTVTAGYLGCATQTASYNIAVNPIPQVVLPQAQTICSGAATTLVNITSTVAGPTFVWTVSSNSGITGYTPGDTGNIIPSQILTNSADTAGTVIYVVTPQANNCSGLPANYVITVNPLPHVILPTAQIICNDGTSNAVNVTSDVANTTFAWASLAENGVSGNTATGSGNIPQQTLHNLNADTASVVYTIVPTANNCVGINNNYVITVEPTPTVVFTPAPQILCSGQSSQLVNLTSSTPGATITWNAVVPAGINGAATSGTTTIPIQAFSNNNVDTIPQPLTINYTAQVSTSGTVCPGTPANYSITIEPVPVVDFSQSIVGGCSPQTINFVPTTLNYGLPDSLIFNWGDGTLVTTLHPNQVQPLWTSANHTFYNNTNQSVTFNVSLIVLSNCLDTTIIHTVTLLPAVVNAFFIPTPTGGCEPLTVQFQDQSTGAGTLTWCFNYNLTNDSCMGGGAVDTAGSVINYTFSGGVYTVALFATNGYGCASDTSFQQITVTPAPVTAFLYNDSLCAQSPITFTSQSTSSAGSIGQYNWQFGDGATASTGNATHQFDTGGVYNVCLAVTSSFGCMDTACHQVTALTKPIAAFTAVDTCLNQQPIIFTNNSTSALFYTWDFADGNTSSSTSPVHSYAASGVYQVKLTAANNYCSTDTTEPVRVFAVPAAAFTIPEPYHCGFPVNIQLTNTSTGASGYVWNFGNGTGSTNNNPSTQYSTDGTYIISLAASNQNGCVDTVIDSFTVYPVPSISSIDILPAEGCQPLPVDFLANGTNVNHLFWNFGDGNTLNTDSVFASHIYSDTGTFSVQLMAYSYATCGDTLFLPDTVQVHIVPVAAFNFSLNENIEPENGTVLFINNSVNSTTYMWNFGDGVTSTDVNPSHLFPSIDSFTVVLIAYSTYGCADSADTTIYIIKKSLYVPNAFAPDFNAGSNLVQVWKPAGIGLLDYHAQIFNKWGELLWESTLLTADRQPAEGWDGTYQNELAQQDVYVWKIDATFIDGTRWQGMSYKFQEVRKTIGSVTLIR